MELPLHNAPPAAMADAHGRTTFNDLPNEILLQILVPFPLPDLLPLVAISHRLSSLVLRIYHARLQAATSLAPRQLLLECYPPILRLTEETLHCHPLGTPGLTPTPAAPTPSPSPPSARLAAYNALYSRFRPYHRSTRRRWLPRRHPAGDVPGSRTWTAASTSATTSTTGTASADGDPAAEVDPTALPYARQQLALEPHEEFAQLKAVTTLFARAHAYTGAFGSLVDVSDGVLRVFRGWLRRQADAAAAEHSRASEAETPVSPEDDPAVLWVNDGMKVGVRFGVRERRRPRRGLQLQQALLVRADEVDDEDEDEDGEARGSFEVEIREVLVRTRHLVRVTERSLEVQHAGEGNKAIVIGQF